MLLHIMVSLAVAPVVFGSLDALRHLGLSYVQKIVNGSGPKMLAASGCVEALAVISGRSSVLS
jgi:hypothetical protein